jgi:hypothetical protein
VRVPARRRTSERLLLPCSPLAPRRPGGVRHSLPAHGRNRTRKASYGMVYLRCGTGEKQRNKLDHSPSQQVFAELSTKSCQAIHK